MISFTHIPPLNLRQSFALSDTSRVFGKSFLLIKRCNLIILYFYKLYHLYRIQNIDMKSQKHGVFCHICVAICHYLDTKFPTLKLMRINLTFLNFTYKKKTQKKARQFIFVECFPLRLWCQTVTYCCPYQVGLILFHFIYIILLCIV